jgi:GT2 family glycosyltransferase
MATPIRNVDLSSTVGPLEGMAGCSRCMVVFRWRTRVVGRAFLDVQDGRVDVADVLSASANLGADALRPWLEETVGYDERDLLGTPVYRATVAICTRERADSLDGVLRAVAGLVREGHEVLVVDNAPKTDQTRQVVERYPGVRYVCELTPGLNVARNRAIREANGDIVAFTDDDAFPEQGWLDNLVRNFGDSRVQCVTGVTLPIELETEAQEMFETVSTFAHGFRRRVFDGQRDNPIAVGEVGVGANMAIRRQVIAEVGPFDERLDGGMPTRSGGDHEMFIRLLSAGHRIVYDPAAVSWHRHRRTHRELVDTLYGYGVGVYAMFTGLLLERRELGVFKQAWLWFRNAHFPELRRMLLNRPATATSELRAAEFRGCLHGPSAWLAARRQRPTGGLR